MFAWLLKGGQRTIHFVTIFTKKKYSKSASESLSTRSIPKKLDDENVIFESKYMTELNKNVKSG